MANGTRMMRIANMHMKQDLIYKELSYEITGLLFKAHNELGRYAREKQYADLFEKLLKDAGMSYKRECVIEYPDLPARSNIVDFVVDGKIILEFKSKPRLFREDFNQILRYLQFSKLKLGILVNFRSAALRTYRVINSGTKA